MRKPRNLSVTGTRTWGTLQHLLRSAKALSAELSNNSEQATEEEKKNTLQGPIQGLSNWHPHFVLPPKWKCPEKWASSQQHPPRPARSRAVTHMQAWARTRHHRCLRRELRWTFCLGACCLNGETNLTLPVITSADPPWPCWLIKC